MARTWYNHRTEEYEDGPFVPRDAIPQDQYSLQLFEISLKAGRTELEAAEVVLLANLSEETRAKIRKPSPGGLSKPTIRKGWKP